MHSTPYIKAVMEKRLEICDACTHKKQLSSLGKLIITSINEQGSTFQCGLCGCPLSTLTASLETSCKIKKWKSVSEESFF